MALGHPLLLPPTPTFRFLITEARPPMLPERLSERHTWAMLTTFLVQLRLMALRLPAMNCK